MSEISRNRYVSSHETAHYEAEFGIIAGYHGISIVLIMHHFAIQE